MYIHSFVVLLIGDKIYDCGFAQFKSVHSALGRIMTESPIQKFKRTTIRLNWKEHRDLIDTYKK